jgi:hypothetical protein
VVYSQASFPLQKVFQPAYSTGEKRAVNMDNFFGEVQNALNFVNVLLKEPVAPRPLIISYGK